MGIMCWYLCQHRKNKWMQSKVDVSILYNFFKLSFFLQGNKATTRQRAKNEESGLSRWQMMMNITLEDLKIIG